MKVKEVKMSKKSIVREEELIVNLYIYHDEETITTEKTICDKIYIE